MKLPTDPYKGVRDFYPVDMSIQQKIFSIWRGVVEKFGYEEYSASVLEPADLFKAKSGEEIVQQQTYTFTDRGDREVTLRPEMTPTVGRMVAAKRRELIYPLRWYSIPNLFRYEQPQRGRIREFWQLNVDIFGVDNLQAEIECIQMAHEITLAYGLKPTDFEIRINSRLILNYIAETICGLEGDNVNKLFKLIDRNKKISKEDFLKEAENIVGDKVQILSTLMSSQNFVEFTEHLKQTSTEHKGLKDVEEVLSALEALGITNARFDQTLTRGADYYTGIIFEIFDLNPQNRRSVFGGGRYDDLLSLFGEEKVSAVGFGAGDVIARDLMETYGTLSSVTHTHADITILVTGYENMLYAQDVAQQLRDKNFKIMIDYSQKKLGDQIKFADKRGIPFVVIIGETEKNTGEFKLKKLSTGEERIHTIDTLQLH